MQEGRCLYCERGLGGSVEVDHFIPWRRYPTDLGHNFVLAHGGCNARKGDRLAAEEHLARWAYGQVERAGGQVWVEGEVLRGLSGRWERVLEGLRA